MSNKAMDPEQLLNALDRYITAQVSLMLSPADKENRVVWARRAGEVERARECLRGELDKLRPDGVKACRACGGKGYTNEGDPEIGNALFDCEACGGSGGIPAGAVLPVSAMAVAPAVSRAQVSSRVDPSACSACVGAGVELEGVNAGRACATCGGTGDACGVPACEGCKPRPMCRDCADEDGTCPRDGLPCDPALRHTCGKYAAGVTVVRDQTEAPADADGLRLEATAREIYDSWKDEPGWVPWVEGGNSTKQDVARQRARDVLAGDPGIGHE